MTTEIYLHRRGLICLFASYRNANMPLSEAFDRLRAVYQKRGWLFVGKHSVEWNFLGQNTRRFWRANSGSFFLPGLYSLSHSLAAIGHRPESSA